MLISEILEKAADLIEPEGRWIRGAYGEKPDGTRVYVESPADGCKFCMIGAVAKVANAHLGQVEHGPLMRAIADAIGTTDLLHVPFWNDAPERTQAEVVAKLREAAAKAREEGK